MRPPWPALGQGAVAVGEPGTGWVDSGGTWDWVAGERGAWNRVGGWWGSLRLGGWWGAV